jgi:hypothetical protein
VPIEAEGIRPASLLIRTIDHILALLHGLLQILLRVIARVLILFESSHYSVLELLLAHFPLSPFITASRAAAASS